MENINFELYKVFYFVAKNKNLSKAANELFISQPAVTQSIQTLEKAIIPLYSNNIYQKIRRRNGI